MANYFPNVSHTVINNPTITHVNGNASFQGNSERQGLRLLLNNISNGAFHDAAERGDPPKCHPDTRVAIREEIMEWTKALEARRKLILWMYGPAGSGKTAIGQSIAEECKKRGLLAASFFFSRTAAGRNDMTRVVATIAYQISRFLPVIENHLFTAIEQDPTIFSRTLATQMQVLVVEPLNTVLAALAGPIFVILDGLDESGPNSRSQADLLNAIGEAISELQHIPLIFLIASRSEYEIREAFAQPFLHSFMRPLELDNKYNPDGDIKLYFNSTFRQIHDKHLRLGAHLPSSWPSDSDVNRLVRKASGQFIFAATVLRFIDSIRHHPQERLDIILGLLAAGNERPFALLDILYHHILSSVADLSQVLEILTLLLLKADVRNPPDLTVGLIGDLLGLNVRRALVDMHALVFVPFADDAGVVRIHHASLYDFLMDRSRSHEFYVGKTQGHITLSRRWLKAIGNRQLSTKIFFPKRVEMFNCHCRDLPISGELADDLAQFNLRALLEEMYMDFAHEIQTTEWREFFYCIKRQVRSAPRRSFAKIEQRAGERVNFLARLQEEFLAFFMEHISKYPSTLRAFVPTILALSANINSGHIFHTLLYAVCQSPEEIEESLKLDSTLLDLYDTYCVDDIFCQLFQDRSLAGHYYVHSGSYLALAKQIVSVIFPSPAERSQKVEFQRSVRRTDSGVQTIDVQVSFDRWFKTILSKASKDYGLAQLLRDTALQYRDDLPHSKETGPVAYGIAWASLAYVERCGLLYLKHTHLEDTDRCIICDEYGADSVVIGTHIRSSRLFPNTFDNIKYSVRSHLRFFRSGW